MEEEWRIIKDFPMYQVSNMGNVKSEFTGKMLALPTSWGYTRISLCHNGVRANKVVHRLVMEAFVGQPPNSKLVINHINGIKTDNRVENLEYCTQSHNRKEDFRLGRQSYLGEKNNSAKLKAADVLCIRELRKRGLKYSEIAKRYNVSISGVCNIFNGHTWSHIS